MRVIKQGIDGFLLFFTIKIFAKFLNYLMISDKFFSIKVGDFYLALLGFIYVVLLKLMGKYRDPIESKFKNL